MRFLRRLLGQWDEGGEGEPFDQVLYSSEAVRQLNIPQDAQDFLIERGLPGDAAPFLSFSAPEGCRFTSVAEMWNLGDYFCPYLVIGSNGSGDPIAIASDGSGGVVYFNHDNRFERVFMNSSVGQLAASLKAYEELVDRTRVEAGDDAFINNDIPMHLQDWIEGTLRDIDPAALGEGCHWREEVDSLRSALAA